MKIPIRRILKIALKSGIVVLLLGGAGWTTWNWLASRRLESVLEEIHAAGLPTHYSHLEHGLPPYTGRPADEENAAYLYRAAGLLLESLGISKEAWTDVDAKTLPDIPEDLRRELGDCEEICELLHRAASRPRCRFDLRWADGFAMELPHLLDMRCLARILASRSIVRTEKGDMDGAIADLRALFALSRAFREEPILVSQLVRIDCARTGMAALRYLLTRSASPIATLEKVDPDRAAGAVQIGLQGELVGMLRIADESGILPHINPGVEWDLLLTVGLPYVRSDLAFLWEKSLRMAEAAREPYPVALNTARELDRELESGGILSRLYAVSYSGMFRSEAVHASDVALASLGARCIEYRHAHGTFPERIDQLTGDTTDPLTAKPFVLETRGDGGIVLRSGGDEDVRWELEAP